jgi:hypothetical protein
MAISPALIYSALIVGAATAGSAVYSGENARKSQSKALKQQEAAQRENVAMAAASQRAARMASSKANQRQPDMVSLLGNEQKSALNGPSSTMLSGSSGQAKLGQSSMLGS